MKKTETKINRLETELQSLVAQQKHLVAEHRWIDTEKQFFGARGTDYDFSGRDLKQTMTQLKKLRDQSLNMEKSINRKVMGMIQKAETEYQGLMKKRKMLENDRLKIEEVIVKLDDQKKEALQKTWAKVTVDFGSIFSTYSWRSQPTAPEGVSDLCPNRNGPPPPPSSGPGGGG